MFYQKNMKFIKKRFPHLLPFLEANQEKEEIEVLSSKTGLLVARMKREDSKIYLNSFYNPEGEAKRWAEGLREDDHSCLIICGGGYFYHIKEILACNYFEKVICYEPNLGILRSCLTNRDLAEILSNPQFFLISSMEHKQNIKLMNHFLGHKIINIRFEVLPAYQKLFATDIENMKKEFGEAIRNSRVNLATTNAFEEHWLENAIKNLSFMIESPGVRHLFNQFREVPAIIAAGGPSLEKNIHLVPAIKENAVVIGAGSSIRGMHRNQVLPHFLVAFDDSEQNAEIYNDLDLEDVCLIYSNRLYHGVVSHYPGRRMHMTIDAEKFSELFVHQSGGYEFGTIRSGFSVAHVALDFAFKLGCNPIILIGQDLAYTGNKRYAEGMIASAQQYLTEEIELPVGAILTKDLHGEDIVTDFELNHFRIWFEKLIENEFQDKIVVLNATEGGIPIKGAENRLLKEVIETYCQQERQIGEKIKKCYDGGLQELAKCNRRVLKIPEQIATLVNEAVPKINNLLERIQNLRKQNFVLEFDFYEWENILNPIILDFAAVLNYKEYEILLKELKATRMPATQIKIDALGEITTKEVYDLKLVGWLDILTETKSYLHKMGKVVQDYQITGEMRHGNEKQKIGSPN